MKLGVITDCFKKGHPAGINYASDLGLDGVQIYATTGEFSPELSTEEKQNYKKYLVKTILLLEYHLQLQFPAHELFFVELQSCISQYHLPILFYRILHSRFLELQNS